MTPHINTYEDQQPQPLLLSPPLTSEQEPEMTMNKKPLLQQHQTSTYGATTLPENSSPRLDRVPEEAVDDAQLDLEDQGYFVGSYKRFITLYSLVPLTSILAFILLAIIPILFLPAYDQRSPPKYFQSPIPELLTGASLWSLSHLLRFPLFTFLSSLFSSSPKFTIIAHTALHVFLYNLFRLSMFPILSVRQNMEFALPTYEDYAFKRIWWASLGWSVVEVGVSVWQGYEQVALYKDVMIPEWRIKQFIDNGGHDVDGEFGIFGGIVEIQFPNTSQFLRSSAADRLICPPQNVAGSVAEAVRVALDHDLDRLVAIKSREELEDVYGMPVINIPVFITCLQRIDSILLSLGLTLLISSSYLTCPLSLPKNSPLSTSPVITSNNPFWITFPLVVVVQTALAMMYTPLVLPKVGIHVVVYIGIVIGLASLFAGLGMWDALT